MNIRRSVEKKKRTDGHPYHSTERIKVASNVDKWHSNIGATVLRKAAKK